MNRSLNKQHCYQTLARMAYDVRELDKQEFNFLFCLLVLCGEDVPEMAVFGAPALSLIVRFGITESSDAYAIYCDLKARAARSNRRQFEWRERAPMPELECISIGAIGHLPLKERIAKIQALLGHQDEDEARIWAHVLEPDFSSFEYAIYWLRRSGF